MKKKDLLIIICVGSLISPFFIFDDVFSAYENFNENYGIVTSFIKFAILATFGESIGLRISEGVYNKKGFGLLPRAVVWGFLGITIKIAFVIFAKGTPVFLSYLGMEGTAAVMKGELSGLKILIAFSISVALNLIYAPVMMTFHKITDIHILNNGGKLNSVFKKIEFVEILKNLNWKVQWNFVFKKTIPFFWIPAHTLTFLLPPDYQVLFAAALGIALGAILAFASLK